MVCPNCGSKLVGKIGARQYYCWECYVEFSRRGNGWQVFELDAEGSLLPRGREGSEGLGEVGA